jgi:hypothetical protein
MENQYEVEFTTETCAVLTNGWARYKNSKSLPPMRFDTLQSFNRLLGLGNNIKSMRIAGDRAHVIVMEDIAAEDWNEQLLSSDTRTISKMS